MVHENEDGFCVECRPEENDRAHRLLTIIQGAGLLYRSEYWPAAAAPRSRLITIYMVVWSHPRDAR